MAQAYVAAQYMVWWPMPPAEAVDVWRRHHLMSLGFTPTGEYGSTIGYSRHGTQIPSWAIILAVVLFPFGLLFLLVKEASEQHLSLGFTPAEGNGTGVTATGRVPPDAQYRLDQLAAWYQRRPA